MIHVFISIGIKENADVIYLVDGSGQVDLKTFNRIKKLVDASIDFYNVSKSETNIGLVQFGGTTEILLRPKDGITKDIVTKYSKSLLRVGGPRLINEALRRVGHELIDKPGETRLETKKVIVLITTGMNAAEGATDLLAEIGRLRTRKVDIVVLSLGEVTNDDELKELADRNIVKVASPEMLPQSYGLLERKIDEAGGKKLLLQQMKIKICK